MTLPGKLVQTERMDPVEKRRVPQHFFNWHLSKLTINILRKYKCQTEALKGNKKFPYVGLWHEGLHKEDLKNLIIKFAVIISFDFILSLHIQEWLECLKNSNKN